MSRDSKTDFSLDGLPSIVPGAGNRTVTVRAASSRELVLHHAETGPANQPLATTGTVRVVRGIARHVAHVDKVKAGLLAPKVLRVATLTAAQVMKRDNELGCIAPGKLADKILVNGDPTTNISDIRKVDTVIKGGAVMYPKELYPAMGIRAQ